jgi:hypothetical protein
MFRANHTNSGGLGKMTDTTSLQSEIAVLRQVLKETLVYLEGDSDRHAGIAMKIQRMLTDPDHHWCVCDDGACVLDDGLL